MRAKKSLLIYSSDKNISRFLHKTIDEVIGHEVNIHSLFLKGKSRKNINPDLIMLSNESVRAEAVDFFPNTPILLAKRILTCSNVEKLLRLPKKEKVLLVNSPRVATEETLESLINYGIDHLNYIPYWPGKELEEKNIETAVSPGMIHLVPKFIKNVIDIGPRTISVHSFLTLLKALDLNPLYLEKFANSYHNLLLKSSHKLTVALDQSELLRKHMEVVFDEFEDGLLSANELGRINLVNTSAIKLLGIDRDKLINQHIDTLIDTFENLADIGEESSNRNTSSGIYSHNQRKILINKIPVVGNQVRSYIYSLREIKRIQKIEENVRIKLAEKGHVTKYDASDIWSKSKKMEELLIKALSFAKTNMNILITGESGTGKELVAHVIHKNSPRRNGPFVAVNFAGLSDSLIESELFGYDEGAFTGAKRGGKRGLFEQAHGGTIFLDEIGDATLNVQTRLLRVLQEKEVRRVGGSKIVPINVRVIAATNSDLWEAIRQKKFRNDLFYRLNTLPLEIPPLRERKEDLIYIINKYLKEHYDITKEMTSETIDCLRMYNWPGNVRELISIAEYMCCSSQDQTAIQLSHIPEYIRTNYELFFKKQQRDDFLGFNPIAKELSKSNFSQEIYRQLLTILLQRKGKVTGRNTLMREMTKYKISLTEGNMKMILKKLNQTDLITVGSTKQGTKITNEGEKFLSLQESPELR